MAGFRPFRLAFCLTLNFPNPVNSTSSPDSRDCLMSSNNISTISIDFMRVYPLLSATELMILALVRVPVSGMVGASFHPGRVKITN